MIKLIPLLEQEQEKEKPSHFVHFGSKNPSFKQNYDFYKENLISTKNIIKVISIVMQYAYVL